MRDAIAIRDEALHLLDRVTSYAEAADLLLGVMKETATHLAENTFLAVSGHDDMVSGVIAAAMRERLEESVADACAENGLTDRVLEAECIEAASTAFNSRIEELWTNTSAGGFA